MERSISAGCRVQSGGAASRRSKMGLDSRRIIISEEQVASTLDMRGAIEAVERGLAAQAHGEAVNMLKTHTAWDGSTLHAIGAVFPKVGLAGTKTWAHTPRGASPLLILFDAEVVISPTVHDAVRGASIITTITRARDPFLHSGMIQRGTHINAVGAILPGRAELSSDVIVRCTQIVSDSPPQAQKLSQELIAVFGSDPDKWNAVGFLGELVISAGKRSSGDDLTLLKSLGTGVLDLSLGIEIYRRVAPLPLGEGAVSK